MRRLPIAWQLCFCFLTVAYVILPIAVTLSAAVPNHLATVQQLAKDNPNTFNCAHTADVSCNANFVKLVACKLNPEPSNGLFGLNGKRGNPNDLSLDVVDYKGEGHGTDPTDGNKPVEIIDIIQGAGGPNATPVWNVIENPGPGAWIKPRCKGDVWDTTAAPPTPPVSTKPPYPGDVYGTLIGDALFQDYATAKQPPNPGMGVWFWRTSWDAAIEGLTTEASIKKHRNEWRAELGLPALPQ
jgi:hypothetical protein